MIELDRTVEDRLRRDLRVWLSTVRASDGSPHVTPVWFIHQPDRWWLGADAASVKVRNLARHPRVSLALEDGTAPVVAEGVATVHHADFPADIVDLFAAKYDGWDVTTPVSPDRPRVLIEIEHTRWLLAGTAQ